MAFNIFETTGATESDVGGVQTWTFSLRRADRVTEVVGDFDASFFGGTAAGTTWSLDYTPDPLREDFFSLENPPGFIDSDGGFTFDIDWSLFDAQIDAGTIVKDRADGRYEYSDGTPVVVRFTVTGTDPSVAFGPDSDTDNVFVEFLICVARGTLVRTPTGEQAIESLEVGDLVSTYDGRNAPVRWIGSRTFEARELQRDPALVPIRIGAETFGPGAPAHDLIVSPQHRVLLNGWQAQLLFGEDSLLAPAKGLLNDRKIRIDSARDEIEYFHLLFDQHEIIFTNGLATESFFPGDGTLEGVTAEVREELFKIFPELEFDPSVYGPSVLTSLRPWEAGLFEPQA